MLKLIKKLFPSWFISYADRCKQAHLDGHMHCKECMFEVTKDGVIVRSVRDTIFFCRFDIPERAGKVRHKLEKFKPHG